MQLFIFVATKAYGRVCPKALFERNYSIASYGVYQKIFKMQGILEISHLMLSFFYGSICGKQKSIF